MPPSSSHRPPPPPPPIRVNHQKEVQRILAQQALEHSASKLAEMQSKLDTQEVGAPPLPSHTAPPPSTPPIRVNQQKEVQRILAQQALEHSASRLAEMQSKLDTQEVGAPPSPPPPPPIRVNHQKEVQRILAQQALEHSASRLAEMQSKLDTQEVGAPPSSSHRPPPPPPPIRENHQKEVQRILAQQALEHSASRLAEMQSKLDTQEVGAPPSFSHRPPPPPPPIRVNHQKEVQRILAQQALEHSASRLAEMQS